MSDQVLVDRDALQFIFDGWLEADEGGLFGKCMTDPCPACTAAEEVQRALTDESS